MTQVPAVRTKKPRLNRAQQKAERSQELLEAARVMFAQKGYEALTIDHVAEYAGCSRMPVYTLFGDKQNLFFELWRQVTANLTGTLFQNFRPGTPLRRSLKALAEQLASSMAVETPSDPEKLFFVVQTIALSRPDIEEKLQALARKVVGDVAGFIRQGALAAGEALRAEPEIIAAHLVAHINGMATVQFQTGARYMKARDLIPIFQSIVFRDG